MQFLVLVLIKSQGELCCGVSNEEIEEVLSDDLELQEDF